MKRPGRHVILLATLITLTGCSYGYPAQLKTIQSEPLADPNLLGLRLEGATDSVGVKGRVAAYVFRVFESPGEPALRVIKRVKRTGLQAGWAAEFCSATPNVSGDGMDYLLYLTKRESGLLATVTADEANLTVEIEGTVPGGSISLLPQTDAPAC